MKIQEKLRFVEHPFYSFVEIDIPPTLAPFNQRAKPFDQIFGVLQNVFTEAQVPLGNGFRFRLVVAFRLKDLPEEVERLRHALEVACHQAHFQASISKSGSECIQLGYDLAG